MTNEEMDFTDAQMLRKKAEELLKEKQKKEPQPNLDVDLKRTLHELQVHQIELELQNEELHLAYETAETALKKYTMLYDLAPMGYFTIDSHGSILDLNFTGSEMLKDKRISLINSNFKLYVSEESREVFNQFFSQVFSSNSKESCEVMLGYDGNLLCDVYMEGIVLGEERNCLLSVVDVSDFKK